LYFGPDSCKNRTRAGVRLGLSTGLAAVCDVGLRFVVMLRSSTLAEVLSSEMKIIEWRKPAKIN
jgi:hypothetical protein